MLVCPGILQASTLTWLPAVAVVLQFLEPLEMAAAAAAVMALVRTITLRELGQRFTVSAAVRDRRRPVVAVEWALSGSQEAAALAVPVEPGYRRLSPEPHRAAPIAPGRTVSAAAVVAAGHRPAAPVALAAVALAL
tara:strand:+ start:691 stop:1098 length:408 start_codon:yes stop_codon:yes gene_type:complete